MQSFWRQQTKERHKEDTEGGREGEIDKWSGREESWPMDGRMVARVTAATAGRRTGEGRKCLNNVRVVSVLLVGGGGGGGGSHGETFAGCFSLKLSKAYGEYVGIP